MPNPNSIPVGVVDSKFEHTIESFLEIRDREPPRFDRLMVLCDVVRIEIKDLLFREWVGVMDGLVEHDTAVVEPEHGPSPFFSKLIDREP